MNKEDNKKLIITIAGKPGSGKSTAGKGVAEKLKFDHFSSGDLFRQIAKEHDMDVLELNKDAETNKKIDYLVDERLREIGKNDNKIVIDSRMAWHWMPYSFRVFLDLDLVTAADRIIKGMTPERMSAENIPTDRNKYAEVLQERLDSEARRYDSFYSVNPYDIKNYDLVVDTNVNNIPQVIELIIKEFKAWTEKHNIAS